MAVILKAPLMAAAAVIRDEFRDKANTAMRIGAEFLALVQAAMFGLDVSSYGASPGASAAVNNAAIAAAIIDALASNASLWWPAGTYLVDQSIANLHSVRHRGPGAIRNGGDTFYVQPRYGSTNRFYVSTTGSAANDGLSAAQPCTLAQAAANLRNYGPILDGFWRIVAAAGTYSTHSVTFDTPSRDWLVVSGPTAGHPNVPTMIVDGTGAGANKFGFLVGAGGARGVQVWCEDIKCQNFNNGTQNSGGWAVTYGAKMIAVNCHTANCDFGGIVADTADNLLVKGGIHSACRSGVIVNNTPGTIGYQASSAADGTQFTGCTQNSVYWSRGAQGHVDYCTFVNAPYHVQIESGSRAHLLGNDFRTATTAAVTTNTDGSYYNDVSVTNNYNDGTGLANAKRYDHFDGTGEQQQVQQVARGIRRLFSDTTTRSLTSATKAQLGADIAAIQNLLYYLTSEGTALRVVVKGDCPAAAFSIGVDLFNALGPTTVSMDYSASTGAPGAVSFTYVCDIQPSAVAVQRTFGTLSVSNLGTREQNTGNAANMALAQTIRLMGQSTSGTITVRRVEVWLLG